MITHLVLSGGGVQGIAILGCLSQLDLSNVTALSGCSAGAILCTCLCVASVEEIYEMINRNELFPDECVDIDCMFVHKGIVNPKFVLNPVSQLLLKKLGCANPTLEELHSKCKKDLWINSTNLTLQKLERFNYKTHPTMPILTAIELSMCIPFVMKSVEYNDCVYVDGGLLEIYPIEPFLQENPHNVMGILVKNDHSASPSCDLIEYAKSVVYTAINNQVKYTNENRILLNVTDGPTFTQTTPDEVDFLYTGGITAAKDWMKKHA